MDLGSGSGVKPLWSGDSESGLVVGMLEVARGRVEGRVGDRVEGRVGSGLDPWPGVGVYGSFKK